jgi:hypothetical protein
MYEPGLPADPDALPRVLGRAEALDRGLTPEEIRWRLESGRWRRVLPATYLTSDTLTGADKVAAALTYAGPHAALSGAAALAESGVKRISRPERLLVLVPADVAKVSARWVQVRRSVRPFAVQQWYGPRRVEVARAVSDLAVTTKRLDDVRALVARVVRDGHCTLDELGAELEAAPRRGSKHLRQALEEVGWGAASAPEAQAARLLRNAGITGFRQNVAIALPGGGRYEADLLWPALRAVLEIDSMEYHLGPAEWRGTMDRHLVLETLGYSVIHRPPSALRDPDRFIRDIRTWLDARALMISGNRGS